MAPQEPKSDCLDAELVRRIRRGDGEAFAQLVGRHGGRLYAVAASMLGNGPDAEDAVQETLTGAFRGLRGFQGRSSVKTWLTRILVRCVAKIRHGRYVRVAEPIDYVEGPPSADPATDIHLDVRDVLADLSEEHRAVIVLRAMQGLSYDEIAEVLDVPRGTVESRLFRARQILKELLKDYLP